MTVSFEASTAAAWALSQVEAVRDNPAARLELVARTYHGPLGRAPRHLPFRRAAMSFMRWQLSRGVLAPLHAIPPGSLWWRGVNERLLRDGCEAVARSGGLAGAPSSHTVELWMSFVADPTARTWYRAHNASIVSAYLDHREVADGESRAERFFLNVVLLRVLYAHALVAAPRLALGRLAALGPFLGDPRLGMTGIFLSLSRVLPDRYPLEDEVAATSSLSATSARCWTMGSSARGCSSSISGQPSSSTSRRYWSAFATAARSIPGPTPTAKSGIRHTAVRRFGPSSELCRRTGIGGHEVS